MSIVLLREDVQFIGIDNLTILRECQPRDKLSVEHTDELYKHVLDGSKLPPVDVFQLPDGTLLLAAGHHRVEVTRRSGESQIRCNVRNGSKEDAIVHAAGSNRKAMLGLGIKPMTPKDVRRAITMLLENGWWDRSAALISKHVGCSKEVVTNVRALFSKMTGKVIPDQFIDVNGNTCLSRPASRNSLNRKISPNGNGKRAKVNRKYLCDPTESGLQEKIDAELAANPPRPSKLARNPQIYCKHCASQFCLTDVQMWALRKHPFFRGPAK